MDKKNIRNFAIVAHVDHGKTTLVDGLLRQSGVFRQNEQVLDCVMDSNELERERGITIFSKSASIVYQGVKFNIVDTPGHADFGGEVERILQMVSGVLLLVDAAEGPLPQTKFVLKKALEKNLKIIVVINKIDRKDAQPAETLDKILDLFIALGAEEHHLDFPLLYASSRQGMAKEHLREEGKDLRPLLETILKKIPAPEGDENAPVQMMVTTTDYSDYLGRLAVGRISNGTLAKNQQVSCVRLGGDVVNFKVTHLSTYEGLKRVEIEQAGTGDIVAVGGLEDIKIGETVASVENPVALPAIQVDEPTLNMIFSSNNSPFFGKEGKFVTSRHLRERLYKEALTNLSLKVEDTDSPDSLKVSGRGELHLGILIETMRREGYEFMVSKPEVILKAGPKGETLEPYEYLVLDVPTEYVGVCMEKTGVRRGNMANMHPSGEGHTRLEFRIPSRGLLGYRSEFLTDTRGEGILNHMFDGYGEYQGALPGRNRGVLIAMEQGISTAYAMYQLQDRGTFFIPSRVDVYGGMIVGENCKDDDIVVNVCKTKAMSNMRSKASDEALTLTPYRKMSLEQCLEYLEKDELLEVTPLNLRLRKRLLGETERKRVQKREASAEA